MVVVILYVESYFKGLPQLEYGLGHTFHRGGYRKRRSLCEDSASVSESYPVEVYEKPTELELLSLSMRDSNASRG